MANARIEIVGPGEYELICQLYNAVFRPPETVAYFDRRLRPRHNPLMLVAELDGQPVGFSCGYELRPSTFYTWLCGVIPAARRLGIGSQLMVAQHAWCRQQGYEMVRIECYNQSRPMILLTVQKGYDIVGIRWDSRTSNNLVIFEKHLTESDD